MGLHGVIVAHTAPFTRAMSLRNQGCPYGHPMLGAKDAALIIGVTPGYVHRLVCAGRLPKRKKHARFVLELDDVEAYALERLANPGQYRVGRGPHPYFATLTEAAEVLGVSPAAVRKLLAKEFLPAVEAPNGRTYFRRPQLQVVARARNERYHPERAGLGLRATVAGSNGDGASP